MTLYIVIITSLVSILAFQSTEVFNKFIFSPYRVNHFKEWYRFITCGIIHADWIHLIINMLVLYSFGGAVEYYYSMVFEDKDWYCFLLLYIGGVAISVLPTYIKQKNNSLYNALGASGAVSAIVFTSILFNPLAKIYLYGIIGVPGIVLGIIYLIYSYYMSKRQSDNINHDAHMWGAIYGLAFTLLLKPSLAKHFILQLLNF